MLAPCGSFESLQAAIQPGCDAVYFGIEQLNMRARAARYFTINDLSRICRITSRNRVKAYLTLNTIMYDHDLSFLRKIVQRAKSTGVDAIIASDVAVMQMASDAGMPVHISTQANITNIKAIEFYSQFADVMVLSRELTLEQVKILVRQVAQRKILGPSGDLVKIEVFAHGALCMAVSGKCYMSLHTHFASANRGACFQNCRRSYIVTDKQDGFEYELNNEYIMSAKDLCTIGFLDKLMGAGVSVLKIEGRGRSEEYVHVTTKCYREAIDAILSGTYNQEKIDKWMLELSTVFNRGFWEGYYLGRKLGEWSNVYGSSSTRKKLYLGRGIKYFTNKKVGEFELEAFDLRPGDQIMVSGPTTGVVTEKVSSIRINDREVKAAIKGDRISISVPRKIRPSDKLYKVIDAKQ